MIARWSFNTGWLTYAGAVVSATPLSMACWAWPSDASAIVHLICIGDSASGGNRNNWALGINATAQVAAYSASNVGESSGVTATNVVTGAWNHCAAVIASSTSRVAYLNGGNSGSNGTSRVPASVNQTTVGSSNVTGGGRLLRGGAFWPAIWNIALTQEDISQLAAGMPPTKVQPQALVAFWDFRGTTQERTWKDTAATLAEAGTNIGVMTPPNVVYRTVFKRRRRAAAAAAASTNVVRDRSSFRFMTGGTFRRMG